MDITLDFRPRDYQLPVLQALEAGCKRAVLVWHRRAGKDLTLWNWTISKALREVGTYYYFLPTYAQGRKVIWHGRDRDGRFFRHYIPRELVRDKHDTDMRIHLINSSIIQVVGVDNVDNLVGTNLRGCVFSEYAIQDPRGWLYIAPILRESGGWAAFAYTPRGRNHGFDLYNRAVALAKKGRWFCQLLTVKDTGFLSDDDLEEERAAGFDEEMIQQEYFCSWLAFVLGSYFGPQMSYLEREKRVREVPWDPGLPVHTAWDLGMDDATAIWFVQKALDSYRLIDYMEASNRGLDFYVKYLRELPYSYGVHLAPHDIQVRELTTGQSRLEFARDLGVDFETVRRLPKADQIDAARKLLPLCYIDSAKCDRGIKALQEYAADYDEDARVNKSRPRHDWASHGADALQVLAVGRDLLDNVVSERQYDAQFDPYNYEKRTYETEFNPFVSQGMYT